MLSVGLLFLSCAVLAEAFFFSGDEEPVLFCIKVCPLYCPTRKHDDDASSLIYVDKPHPQIPYHHGDRGYYEDHGYKEDQGYQEVRGYNEDYGYHEDHRYHEVIPYHFDPYYFCKPHKSTTTPAPTTTTTEEPTFICMICIKNCSKYPKTKKS
ncbi:jg7350 [Pararge aegeria aegeria]|uniref:Jg7350 protein n=1 Tax=Pararge aegeria aegeria TaxID=348720 RepID=A0A8S4RFX3_9NEOP|nr:jg7350 [Pararge aegeria aegeria]